ncbi:phage holin family protein [Limosilactobacillus reuteri]|uniref:phage holin, LLH family n=1 Tax=Limosilactobacillus reuteri TaxID=1598 RepID=UPI001E3D8167|nr:phage holin, LLH family [Limosilactobacillus reuteri]MCC4396363.1 phage holin family protein [Limosilactobacillus reuteri]MCC4402369.1 phage holin family protein [Limosilactobacillus reuteri]
MKMINDIVYWFISSGTAAVLFIFAWKYLKPVLEAKKLHAKTLQEKELLDVLEKLADNAVTSLVSNQALTGHDKFKAATQTVGSTLAEKGFNVSQSTVEHAIQSAYEKSDLTPTNPQSDQIKTGVTVTNATIPTDKIEDISAGQIKTGVINND